MICVAKPTVCDDTVGGWALPHQSATYCDCCASGSSCNTCPEGSIIENDYCAGKGNRRCKAYGMAECTCDNGVVVDRCTEDGAEMCQSCHTGYKLVEDGDRMV